jgi:hypothetical protein
VQTRQTSSSLPLRFDSIGGLRRPLFGQKLRVKARVLNAMEKRNVLPNCGVEVQTVEKIKVRDTVSVKQAALPWRFAPAFRNVQVKVRELLSSGRYYGHVAVREML